MNNDPINTLIQYAIKKLHFNEIQCHWSTQQQNPENLYSMNTGETTVDKYVQILVSIISP